MLRFRPEYFITLKEKYGFEAAVSGYKLTWLLKLVGSHFKLRTLHKHTPCTTQYSTSTEDHQSDEGDE